MRGKCLRGRSDHRGDFRVKVADLPLCVTTKGVTVETKREWETNGTRGRIGRTSPSMASASRMPTRYFLDLASPSKTTALLTGKNGSLLWACWLDVWLSSPIHRAMRGRALSP